MSEIPANQLERFPISDLTSDEIGILQGLEYGSLKEELVISSQVLKACLNVWNTNPIKKGLSSSESARRLRNHFVELAKNGDDNARRHMAHLEKYEYESVVELGQQFYLDGSDVIVGVIHQGKINYILLRDELDDINDDKSIVQIHRHLDDKPQSFDDIIGITADKEGIPEKCMYYVVGPNKLHMMFPTLNTPRIRLEDLRPQIEIYVQRYIADRSMEFTEIIREISNDYSLGYYSSAKQARLIRII